MPNQFEQRLSDNSQPYKLIADKLVDVVFVLDGSNLEYLYVSPSVKDFRGYEPQEVLNRTLKEILTPDSYQKALQHYKVMLDKYRMGLDPKGKVELEMYKKDGTTVWGELTACFTKDDQGQILILGVTRDITKRKKLEDERKTLIDELKAALAEQERLARENRVLRGLLPICAQCKRIRDENGKWHDFEIFIQERSQAQFTHTICPPCQKKLYPELSR